MKLKKALSGILAAAMAVSLTPAMAFATSSNTVAAVPTVSTDEGMPATTVSFEIKDASWNGKQQHVKLSFENAEWDTKPTVGVGSALTEKMAFTVSAKGTNGDKIVFSDGTNSFIYTSDGTCADTAAEATAIATAVGTNLVGWAVSASSSVVTFESTTANTNVSDLGAAVTRVSTGTLAGTAVTSDGASATDIATYMTIDGDAGISSVDQVLNVNDSSIEFIFTGVATSTKGKFVNINFAANALKSGDTDGPVLISVDGLDSMVTSSQLTVANVGSSTTVATVNENPKTFDRQTVTNAQIKTSIEIRETAVNSLRVGDVQTMELRLPKGVTWNTSDMSIQGNLASSYTFTPDGRYLTIKFTVGGSDATRDVMTIMPSIIIGKDASKGDIAVSIVGKTSVQNKDVVSDAYDLVIAKYGEEGVEVSTLDSVPTVYSGYLADKNDKEFKLYVTLKENMIDALTENKFVDFDLPEEVQVCGAIKTSDKAGDKGTFAVTNLGSYITIGEDDIKNNDSELTSKLKDQDASSFTFAVPTGTPVVGGVSWSNSKGNTITFEIPVTVKANYTGDITLNVSGAKAGVEDTDLVIGTAESPIAVETATTEVKNGVQKQAVANITITENITGYIDDKTTLTLTLDDLGLTNALVFDDAEAKVTAGDMEIGKISVDDGVISIPVKNASTKVSTIEVSAITATLNRTLPEGGYDLEVGGSALVENAKYDDEDFTGTAVKVKDYLKIVTPAESVTVSEKVDAKFVIGEASYTNNGAATEMDAAAYIDSHNRTMVPIRYVANACGISENDIRWEQNTQTAIINGLNTVVTVKMGSNKLQTSTGEITMDTVAVNNNGRIYVPVRYIANALGANVSWDAATKTVTLTK